MVFRRTEGIGYEEISLHGAGIGSGVALRCSSLAREASGDIMASSIKEAEHTRGGWSTVPKSGDLRPLCYEHHIRMEFNRFVATPGEEKRIGCYLCPEPGCSVRFNLREGYFMMIRHKEYTERDIIPCVSCPRDGGLMYLAQTKQANRSFRLWRCPRCRMTRTNREVLRPS